MKVCFQHRDLWDVGRRNPRAVGLATIPLRNVLCTQGEGWSGGQGRCVGCIIIHVQGWFKWRSGDHRWRRSTLPGDDEKVTLGMELEGVGGHQHPMLSTKAPSQRRRKTRRRKELSSPSAHYSISKVTMLVIINSHWEWQQVYQLIKNHHVMQAMPAQSQECSTSNSQWRTMKAIGSTRSFNLWRTVTANGEDNRFGRSNLGTGSDLPMSFTMTFCNMYSSWESCMIDHF